MFDCDGQRRKQSQYRCVRAVHEDPALLQRVSDRLTFHFEIDADHTTVSPCLTYEEGKFLVKPAADFMQLFSDCGCILHESTVDDFLQDSDSGGAGYRISSERRTVNAVGKCFGNAVITEDPPQGESSADCFGDQHDVRAKTRLLKPEKSARSAYPGLNLVRNDEKAERVSKFIQRRGEFRRHREDASFSLDAFQHDRECLCIDPGPQRIDVVEFQRAETGQHRLIAVPILGFVHQRKRCESASVERIGHSKDPGFPRSPSPLPYQLYRTFEGFCAAVAEEGPAESRRTQQSLNELDLRFLHEEIRKMDIFARLLFDCP